MKMMSQRPVDLFVQSKVSAWGVLLLFLVWPDALQARTQTGDGGAEPLRFERDIRPILSENCFSCHGFDDQSRQTDLRLDIPNPEISKVIGKEGAEASLLFRRITSANASQRMPPPDSHLELTAAEIEKIRRWIEQGGELSPHWSLVPPRRPPIPDPVDLEPGLKNGPSPNPVDQFVRRERVARGLAAAPAADRYTLIRRAYLDLVGFPPAAEEVQQFVEDPDPQAYENLIRRLLDSPHFGERLALDWLDAARYADTNGFSIDGGRTMWLWRDWVIQAFNDNLPYDQFLRTQLAGDLFPDRTDWHRIATGFQRNSMVTHEGGTLPEENLANYNADRIKTFGESILGLTLACAQCHTHKYDPVTHQEYYQLTAFFNTIQQRGLDGDGGNNSHPSLQARTVLKTNELPELRQRIEQLQQQLGTLDVPLLSRWEEVQLRRLAERGKDFQLYPAEVLNITTPNMGSGFQVDGFNQVRISALGWLSAFDMAMKLPALDQPIRGVRVTFHPLADLPGNGWGGGRRKLLVEDQEVEKGTFILTGFSVTADQVPSDQVNLYQLAKVQSVSASCWEEAFPPRETLDPRNPTGWSPRLTSTEAVRFSITLTDPIDSQKTPYLTVQLNFGYGQSMMAGKFQFDVFTGIDDDIDLPPEIIALLELEGNQRTAEQIGQLWDYCRMTTDELWHERVELQNLQERVSVLTDSFPTMVMEESENPPQTFVFARGDYSQPTEAVSPGIPSSLPPLAEHLPANRLGLAHWVTMPENPLTARVAVNRFWQLLFGRGIVETAADFGSQGSWPSHPELLDWLAVEFHESGWNVKELLFLLMTSDTYRQQSDSSPSDLATDPDNIWLARGPRFRLSAELIRDSALKVSGLLVPRIGGPSVNPYTQGDPWREVSHYGSTPATSQVFVQDHGEKLYRRSLYTYWKRTAPPANMTIFDAPNREVCVVSRPTTTTPLQALILLNDVQFVEASRGLAQRMLQRQQSDEQRIQWGVLEVLGRPITAQEKQILLIALERERARYRQQPEAAQRFLSNGESRRDKSIDPVEHAAWGAIASLLLNSSELITRH
jgi:hypothetical protein